MQYKNKDINMWSTLEKHFLSPFFFSLFLILLSSLIFGLKISFINPGNTIYISLVTGFIPFFLWFKRKNIENNRRKIVLKWSSGIFLITLAIISISSVLFLTQFDLPLIKDLFPLLSLLSFFSGVILFYSNKARIEEEIDIEKNDELESEKNRYLEFPQKFPKINKVPILNSIFRRFYKEGILYSLIVILILTVFVDLKSPYMNLSFTGDHNMKYSAYIEPAKHMLENGPLWNQTTYQADPITSPEGKFDSFGQYPIIEWGVVLMNKIFPSYSLEFNTRIFMAFTGIILLTLMYRFFKEFLGKKQTLLAMFLISTNVIYQFFTYVTVLDPINLIFLFLSLIFLADGLKKEDAKKIFLSGIVAGIGISIKYHALIFYFPIFILFLVLYRKLDQEKVISYILIIFPNFILQTILFRISFRYLPKNFLLFILIFFIIILLQIFLYKKINKVSVILENFLIGKAKLFYSVSAVFIITTLFLIFSVSWIKTLFSDFITDKYLIFNWSMYSTFLDRYETWLTPLVYYFSIALFFLVFLIKKAKVKLLMFSFLISSLIYVILTSKVLYFHEYYHHITLITFILFFSFIYYLTKLFEKLFYKIVIYISLICIVSVVSFQSIQASTAKLSIEKPEMLVVGDYIKTHLKQNEFFIYSADISTAISFYSNRPSLIATLPLDYNKELINLMREDIKNNIPFDEVVKKYKISLYLTKSSPESKNNDFSYLFTTENESSQSLPERTIIILCKENNLCHSDNRFLPEVGFEDFEKNVKPHLLLLQKIGVYYIYQFI